MAKLLLVKDYLFEIDSHKITIPSGYTWDGANIPLIFQPIVGKRFAVINMLPSLVHDYLIEINWDVKERDLKFYSVLLETGRNKKIAYMMYLAVCLYSFIYF